MKLSLYFLSALASTSLAAISKVSLGGSGCPQGSTVSVVSDYPTSFQLLVGSNSFVAKIGDGATAAEKYKNCQVSVTLSQAANVQYAVSYGRHTGSIDISSGVTAVSSAIYYFSGETAQTSTQQSFTGPAKRNFSIRQPTANTVWSPCGKSTALNINQRVILSGSGRGTATGVVGGKINFSVALLRRAC
jgi:hypothetical protein